MGAQALPVRHDFEFPRSICISPPSIPPSRMKLLATFFSLAPVVLGLPASGPTSSVIVERQTASQITDQYLYTITLAAFTARRNARDPPTLIWDSDGCSSSPDNPFGFPFTPACHRHDFGYRNYKNQNRFTDNGKLKVDNQFKTE